jgi:hypothetical protein
MEPSQMMYNWMPATFQSPIYKDQLKITKNLVAGFSKYSNEFLFPFLMATYYFSNVELKKFLGNSPVDRFNAYMDLFEFNTDLVLRYFTGSAKAMEDYSVREMKNYIEASYNSFFNLKGENLEAFYARQSDVFETVTQKFPRAIREIEPEYGFHFEREGDIKFAETDRFIVYKILPTDKKITVNDKMKPVLIIPPYVLGHNILAFLPGENKSYTHSFANQGIPTYIRIAKDIATTPQFQVMTIEEDALDTGYFCKKIMDSHGKQVTLNGYCQGGYIAVCNYLSGQLDGVVDSLITCVAPMDGTKSRGLGTFLKNLPPRFNDLIYGTKTLPSGNQVADGDLMGWVYKLKSIEDEAPIVSFFRDLFMVSSKGDKPRKKISKTAAALNYWLQTERCDLPLSVTQMSFDSYNKTVRDDGTLPITMFGSKLNFNRIREKNIPWLICYGKTDDLVERETALAPLNFVDAELSCFPKGHAAMATSWSNPKSECALHKRFGKQNHRGPVRFQLDLDSELDKIRKKTETKAAKKPVVKEAKKANEPKAEEPKKATPKTGKKKTNK